MYELSTDILEGTLISKLVCCLGTSFYARYGMLVKKGVVSKKATQALCPFLLFLESYMKFDLFVLSDECVMKTGFTNILLLLMKYAEYHV